MTRAPIDIAAELARLEVLTNFELRGEWRPLMTGRDATIDALAQRLSVKRDYVSAHIRLTYLAPDIVKDLFEGRQPEGLTAARLASVCKDLPHDWQLQRGFLGSETR